LLLRFIYPAPFSKFYLELDSQSPGQIGKFIGLRIVQAYAERNPDTPLVKLLTLSSEELFNKSLYKPKK